jgi:hypothetical protein
VDDYHAIAAIFGIEAFGHWKLASFDNVISAALARMDSNQQSTRSADIDDELQVRRGDPRCEP